jgi:hypothetical protein
MKKVILLDIDGVLVQHGGYRAALHATLNHFAHLMGAPRYDLSEEQLSELEKRGIFSEWDMAPLLLGTLWNEILAHHPNIRLPTNLSAAAIEIGRVLNHEHLPEHLHIPHFDIKDGQYPAESALQHGCFPLIPYDLRVKLLSQTRDIHFSETMKLFQHFSLGSEIFSQTYHLPAEIETESLLAKHDISNLTDEIRAELTREGNFLSALTARPSSPPKEILDPPVGYAPEAELALEMVGLAHIPLIAFGKLEYLAAQRGLDPSNILKPSPVHALAATAAALTDDEWAGLQSAGDWLKTGKLDGVFKNLPKEFELIVVEDTMGGIRSTLSAGEILNQNGFQVRTRALGMTSGSPSKADLFSQAKVEHFKNWKEIIRELA